MKKIVIIGANEFQNPLIEKAKSLGYETHVFAWQSGDIGEKTADYFYPISIVEKEEILEECKKIKPDAITSIGSDLAVITVNYVANALGLNCNNPEYSLICTNKFEMRKAFEKANIKIPRFEKLKSIDEVTINKFPLIVKPTDRSGSRSIALVHSKEELENAILKACESSFEKYAIVEEVIEGKNEYSCESISFKGKHTILAITKKFTTGFPSCIETGHIEPADLPENIKTIDEIGNIEIDQVVIGSCTNGRLSDLKIAAEILRGRKINNRVRCIIIPATQYVYLQAVKLGFVEIFINAGAVVSTPTCGPCLGGHMGILASKERAVSTTNRNFVGRMGHIDSEVYLASPAVAAASAVTGIIQDPNKL